MGTLVPDLDKPLPEIVAAITEHTRAFPEGTVLFDMNRYQDTTAVRIYGILKDAISLIQGNDESMHISDDFVGRIIVKDR